MSSTPSSAPSPEALARLADVVHDLAHLLDIRNPDLRDVVPLTGTEIAVIREIHRHPGASPSQIAQATRLQRSNVSTTLRALEAGGLVTREAGPGNARSVSLWPTAQAADNVAMINAYWARRLSAAPEGDIARALESLDALARIAASLER